MLFKMYVRHLLLQVCHCLLVSYADDSTLLKVVPSRESCKLAAEEINSDLDLLFAGGRGGILNMNLLHQVIYAFTEVRS